ncbi:hypothetical protein [Streptomyces sp. NPDC048196]|uniref:hypothetical protein n=1 Tax=Streptomyces sp. NPDC048196 TaxID=3154712 RepID=UPI0034061421
MSRRAPLDWLLTTAADKLPTGSPNAPITRERIALTIELVIWDWHGTGDPTTDSIADTNALRSVLLGLPIRGATRAEYAARVRLAAQGVSL